MANTFRFRCILINHVSALSENTATMQLCLVFWCPGSSNSPIFTMIAAKLARKNKTSTYDDGVWDEIKPHLPDECITIT